MFKELSEGLKNIKKIQSEMKDTLIEISNFQRNNGSVNEVENQINDLEHKEPKNNHVEQEEKRIQKNEDDANILWDNFKNSNICLMGCQEKRRGKKLEIYLKK